MTRNTNIEILIDAARIEQERLKLQLELAKIKQENRRLTKQIDDINNDVENDIKKTYGWYESSYNPPYSDFTYCNAN